jgi:hypothetical protein
MKHFKQIVHDFFLTDHVYEEIGKEEQQGIAADATVAFLERNVVKVSSSTSVKSEVEFQLVAKDDSSVEDNKQMPSSSMSHERKIVSEPISTPSGGSSSPLVQPKTVRRRATIDSREHLRRQLMKTKTLTFSDRDSHRNVKRESEYFDSPVTVFMILFGLMMFFLWLPKVTIELQLDGACVLMIICAAIGMSLAPELQEKSSSSHSVGEIMQSRARVDSESLMRMS